MIRSGLILPLAFTYSKRNLLLCVIGLRHVTQAYYTEPDAPTGGRYEISLCRCASSAVLRANKLLCLLTGEMIN